MLGKLIGGGVLFYKEIKHLGVSSKRFWFPRSGRRRLCPQSRSLSCLRNGGVAAAFTSASAYDRLTEVMRLVVSFSWYRGVMNLSTIQTSP